MKKLISTTLALVMIVSLTGLSMASELDSMEALEQEIEKNKVATQQMIENIDKELAEIQQQIKASPNVGRIEDNTNFPSPRLPCSSCGSALKYFNRTYMGEARCEKYQVGVQVYDKLYMYNYECNSCGNLDSYMQVLCTH